MGNICSGLLDQLGLCDIHCDAMESIRGTDHIFGRETQRSTKLKTSGLLSRANDTTKCWKSHRISVLAVTILDPSVPEIRNLQEQTPTVILIYRPRQDRRHM